MHISTLVSLFLPILATAAPKPEGTTTTCVDGPLSSHGYSSTTTRTINMTLTFTRTYTHTVTPSSYYPTNKSTTSAPAPQPTKPYTIISARSGSPIHLLPVNAAGFRFYLGGNAASYCPSVVTEEGGTCPPGDVTALLGTSSMDVEVPGGQQIWAQPDGTIGYTQAHSISAPIDSVPGPFSWTKGDGEQFGHLSTAVFGATGLMACPDVGGSWQVLAAVKNATVPNGNVSSCLGFDGLTMDYSSSTSNFAAWQYT